MKELGSNETLGMFLKIWLEQDTRNPYRGFMVNEGYQCNDKDSGAGDDPGHPNIAWNL